MCLFHKLPWLVCNLFRCYLTKKEIYFTKKIKKKKNKKDYIQTDYIGIKISRSSALSMNVLLIFHMHDLNGALFLQGNFLFLLLAL